MDENALHRVWERETGELFAALHPYIEAAGDPIIVMEVLSRYMALLIAAYPVSAEREEFLDQVMRRIEGYIDDIDSGRTTIRAEIIVERPDPSPGPS